MKTLLFTTILALGATAAVAQTTPERDARGIPVVSAPAAAPAGANEVVAPVAGATVVPKPDQAAVFAAKPSTATYPPCSKTVTDGCVQTYERGVKR